MSKETQLYIKNTFVSPGEKLGVIEEFIPGKGTYVEDGNIFSLATGQLVVDRGKRELFISQKTHQPLIPKADDIVIGDVIGVQDKTLTVNILQIGNTQLPDSFTGIMHISDVGTTFVRTMSDAFKVGDMIRAKVISTKNKEFHLSTQSDKLGVVKATCIHCGGSLVNQKNTLKCIQCNRVDRRKLASDFGQGQFGLEETCQK